MKLAHQGLHPGLLPCSNLLPVQHTKSRCAVSVLQVCGQGVAMFPGIRQLELSLSPQVCDESVTALAACTALSRLNLGGCDVSDAALPALAAELPSLASLSLSSCQVVGRCLCTLRLPSPQASCNLQQSSASTYHMLTQMHSAVVVHSHPRRPWCATGAAVRAAGQPGGADGPDGAGRLAVPRRGRGHAGVAAGAAGAAGPERQRLPLAHGRWPGGDPAVAKLGECRLCWSQLETYHTAQPPFMLIRPTWLPTLCCLLTLVLAVVQMLAAHCPKRLRHVTVAGAGNGLVTRQVR
jgi:hypothetical protein